MARVPPVRRRRLGLAHYGPTLRDMRAFTDARHAHTADELWLLEHPPVFTLGQAGRVEHVLAPGDVPVVQSDRGGQVTYHGPGQLVLYVLLDMRRLGLGVRTLVAALEQSVIDLLASHGVGAERRERAPGVYVDGAKVAALGLRVRNACSYHGIALNVDVDLGPFSRINPCGYQGLEVTSLERLGIGLPLAAAGDALSRHLAGELGLELAPEAGERAAAAGAA